MENQTNIRLFIKLIQIKDSTFRQKAIRNSKFGIRNSKYPISYSYPLLLFPTPTPTPTPIPRLYTTTFTILFGTTIIFLGSFPSSQ
jgi:hypothetical protein